MDPEAVAGARAAAAHAERWKHGFLGEDGEPGGGSEDAHGTTQAETTSPSARSPGVGAQGRLLHAHGIELLDGLDRLDRGHVALRPRANAVAAVPTEEGAGPASRILVEDERLARAGMRPADVAVVAATLQIAGDAAIQGGSESAQHGRLDAVLHLDHPT